MKKLLILVLMSLAIIAFSGCTGDDDHSSGQSTKKYGPVFISLAPTTANVGIAYDYEVIVADADTDEAFITIQVNSDDTCGGVFTKAAIINGHYVFTPAPAQLNTQCVVGLTANDSNKSVKQNTTVNIVAAPNRAPYFTSTAPTTATEDVAYTYNIAAADDDVPGQSLTLTVSGLDTCDGVLTDNGDGTGTYTFTPDESEGGSQCVVGLTVTDSDAASSDQDTVVDIGEVNQAPVNNAPSTASGDESTAISFDMAPTDPDVPVQTLSCSFVSSTCPGVAAGNLVGSSFSWTPTESDGPTTCDVTTRVSDGALQSDVTTTITVNEVNTAPVWTAVPADIAIGVNSVYSAGNGSASDADLPNVAGGDPGYLTCSNDGDTCSFTVTVAGSGAGAASCNVAFTSGATSESCTVQVRVSDGLGLAATQAINIDVTSTWYVDPNAVGAGTCDSWADACTTIQAAMALAVYGDQVWVKGDEVYVDTTGLGDTVLAMKDGVHVYGGFNGDETLLSERNNPPLLPSILDGQDSVLHVVIGASYATLDGFRIMGGHSYDYGGGIINSYVYDTMFNNLNIEQNFGYYGGGIANLDYSDVTIDNSSLEYNYSAYVGGGIFNGTLDYDSSTAAYLTISNSSVSFNYSPDGGGGMLNQYSYSVISNSVFNNNYVYGNIELSGGGLSNIFSYSKISDSAFCYNRANLGGGIENIYSSPYIENCMINTNFSFIGGGMNNIYSSPTISDTIFIENMATSYANAVGGGMVNFYYSSPIISNSIFTLNVALSYDYEYGIAYGGGMYNYASDPMVNDTTFILNAAIVYGGPGYNAFGGGMMNRESNPTINGGSMKQNLSIYGGAIANDYSYTGIYNSNINTNFGTYSGGGIWNNYSELFISDSVFNGNRTSYGPGAGIYSSYTGFYIYDSEFTNNYAYENGGAMYCYQCDDLSVVEGAVIEGNYSGNAGGALYVQGTDLIINNSILNNNTADEKGGAIYQENSDSWIQDVHFEGNTALSGGGIFNLNSYPDVISCDFTANVAIAPSSSFLGGGAMYNYTSSPTIRDSTFRDNFCHIHSGVGFPGYYGGGAGIFNREYSSPIISGSVFENNYAFAGGAVFNAMYSSPQISNTIIRNNTAFAGGGVFNAFSSSPYLMNVLIVENSNTLTNYADYGLPYDTGPGGGVFNAYASNPAITNATFADNFSGWGGAVFNFYGSNPVISNSILWGDIATHGDDEINNAEVGTPCAPTVSYSDVDNSGYAGVNGNIRNDPLFVGDYFLSHIATGQASDSPAIDMGNPGSPLFGTTRTDGVPDVNILDMGYHRLIP